jgi:hypothetical protein
MRRNRLYAALFWAVWIAICLLAQPTDVHSQRAAIATALRICVLPVISYLWCKEDAAARSVQPPPGAIPLLAVLVPVGLAYYVIATRSALRACGVIIGAVFVTLGVTAGGEFLRGSGVQF